MKKLFLLFFAFAILANAQDKKVPLKKGMIFPDFELFGLDGKKIRSKSLKNKVVFINLWFTDCAPCVEEMPVLNKLAKVYEGKVVFLSMTFESSSKVREFLRNQKFNFTHLVGAGDFIAEKIVTNHYPKNIIVDRKGRIRLFNSGIPFTRDEETGEMSPLPYTFFKPVLDQVLAE